MHATRVASLVSGALLMQAAALAGAAQEDRPVTLRFAGAVNGSAFECGRQYSGVGSGGSTIEPGDFRFFVSAVELIGRDGKAVPVALDQDGVWQYRDVALVDLENGAGACGNGTAAVHAEVSGRVPRGEYTGVRFTLGVPFESNHGDPTLAPSPLNLTAMFWNWQGGYKFLKVDLNSAVQSAHAMAGAHGADAGARHAGGHDAASAPGFALHLGSTQCAARSQTESPSACRNPNRVTVTFEGFDPDRNTIVADIGAVLAGTDVERNAPDTSPGCMSFPKDADCTAVMNALGLPYDGIAPAGAQKFFSMK
ncbi:MAG: MbnP family copper-binding protein [Gammaproteobacteria bacterium]